MREVYTGMDPKEIESEYLNGVYNEIANTLGIEAAVKLYSTYRGQQITVAEYDGKNVRQLATKYGYSEKWIRKMIKEHASGQK